MLKSKSSHIVSLDLQVGTSNLGPHWMAFESRLGIAVFDDGEEEAVQRLRRAVDFTFDNVRNRPEGFAVLQKYLTDHGVGYSLLEEPPEHIVSVSVRPDVEFALAS